MLLSLLLTACTGEEAPAPAPEPIVEAPAAPSDDPRYPSRLRIDGEEVQVRWGDGDTFSIRPEGAEKPVKARLAGFNTLESYGPVHRWGEWTAAELYALSKQAGVRAASEAWTCTDTGEGGGYGRALVDCPDLRRALLSEGMAHAFAVDGVADPADLKAQQDAIKAGAGMWAKGAPEGLITSLHSLDEREGQDETYNRVASLSTGAAEKSPHKASYAVCEEVCVAGSCMTYVPYEVRYGDKRAACLGPDEAGGEE